MRGAPYSMEVLRPGSVEEAVATYGRMPDAVPLAGGTVESIEAPATAQQRQPSVPRLSARNLRERIPDNPQVKSALNDWLRRHSVATLEVADARLNANAAVASSPAGTGKT